MKSKKTYSIVFVGGINDGKTCNGLKNSVTVDGYKKTDIIKDGRIVFLKKDCQ